MAKTITQSEIDTLKYMFGTFPESTRKTLIENQCAKYKLTPDFIREFKEYISKKDFTTSLELSYDMIKMFEDMFDVETWIGHVDKSLEPLMHDDFIEKHLKERDLNHIIAYSNAKSITKEVFEKHFENLSNDVKAFIINASHITDEGLIRKYPGMVDEDAFKNKSMKVEWTNSLIEYVLTNKKLTVKVLISALRKTKDFGFMKRMLETKFDYAQSAETYDDLLKEFIFTIPEIYYPRLFELLDEFSSNAITYDVLMALLITNQFLEEKFLIDNLTHFKRNGLTGKFAEYARANDYKSVMVALKLS